MCQPSSARSSLLWIQRILFIIFFCSGCTISYRLAPTFSRQLYPLKRLAVIPIQFDYKEQSIGSIVSAESPKLIEFTKSVSDAIAYSLRPLGIEVLLPFANSPTITTNNISDASELLIFEGELERQKAISDIRFADSRANLKKYFKAIPIDSVLSEKIPEISSSLGVDGLIFAHIIATELSSSGYGMELARSIMIATSTPFYLDIAQKNYISGDIMIVDGISSRVIYYNYVEEASISPTDKEEIGDLMVDLLSPFSDAYLKSEVNSIAN